MYRPIDCQAPHYIAKAGRSINENNKTVYEYSVKRSYTEITNMETIY